MIVLKILRKIERIVMYVAYTILVTATLIGIITRIVPGFKNIVWGMELSRFCMVWLVMMINSVNIKERDEIVIEVLITRVSDKVRRIMALISDILVIAFLVIMFWYGLKVCMANKNQMTASLGITMNYVYMCMPLGAFCMLLEKVIVFIQDVKSKTAIKTMNEEVIDSL